MSFSLQLKNACINKYIEKHADTDCLHPGRLKTALARRTGRSEEELCFEERRRSARVAEEENLNLEESGLVLERGSRRARKEEPKLCDVCICSGAFLKIHSLNIKLKSNAFYFFFV